MPARVFLSLIAFAFPPLHFHLPLPLSLSILPKCVSTIKKQKEKGGREKIESEIVGVKGKKWLAEMGR